MDKIKELNNLINQFQVIMGCKFKGHVEDYIEAKLQIPSGYIWRAKINYRSPKRDNHADSFQELIWKIERLLIEFKKQNDQTRI